MLRKGLSAVAAASFLITNVAVAQDGAGGIWSNYKSHRKRPSAEESVPASALPGLVAGLAVQTSDGRAVGRISKVVTGSDGSIRKVIVVSPVGNLLKVAPSTLTVSNGVVTMTEERTNS